MNCTLAACPSCNAGNEEDGEEDGAHLLSNWTNAPATPARLCPWVSPGNSDGFTWAGFGMDLSNAEVDRMGMALDQCAN